MFGWLLSSTIGILLVLEQKAPSPICFYVEHEFREASLAGIPGWGSIWNPQGDTDAYVGKDKVNGILKSNGIYYWSRYQARTYRHRLHLCGVSQVCVLGSCQIKDRWGTLQLTPSLKCFYAGHPNTEKCRAVKWWPSAVSWIKSLGKDSTFMWSEGEVGSFSKHPQIIIFCSSFCAQAFPRQVLDIQLKEWGVG